MPKVLIEVVNGGESRKGKYPVHEGKIIIKKGGKGAGDLKWEPEYKPDRFVEEKFLIWKTKKAYYLANSKELMPIVPNGQPPDFTAEPILKASKEKLLEQQAKTRQNITQIEMIILLVVIGIAIAQFLIMSNLGIINIGLILGSGNKWIKNKLNK